MQRAWTPAMHKGHAGSITARGKRTPRLDAVQTIKYEIAFREDLTGEFFKSAPKG